MKKDNQASLYFHWPVTARQEIAAPAEQVWEVISEPGNLEKCHPFCEKNPVSKWPGEGAEDTISYLCGWIYKRRFTAWIEGVGYDLEIGVEGGKKSSVSWRITPLDDNRCRLNITVFPHLLQGIPLILRWIPHLAIVKPRLSSYLSSVVRGFEWYITRGEAVKKNQFGTHPWFS